MSTTLEPVRLAMYCTGCIPGYHLPCFAGITSGIFRRHGLEVEMFDPEPGPANILAVDAGRYDLCLTSVAHFLNAKREQPEIAPRFVFMLARRTHMAAFAVADRPAAHGRPIKSHADLDGASVLGTADSAFIGEYTALLHQIGCAPGPIVEMPYEDIIPALVRGQGDVAPDFVNLHPKFQAAAAGTPARVDCLPFFEAGVDVYGSGLVAGRALREERPEVLQSAIDALREAVIATREDPDLGIQALAERIPTANPDLALADWRAGEVLIFGEDAELGAMNAETWQRTLDYFADAYGDPGELEPSAVADMSFLGAPEGQPAG